MGYRLGRLFVILHHGRVSDYVGVHHGGEAATFFLGHGAHSGIQTALNIRCWAGRRKQNNPPARACIRREWRESQPHPRIQEGDPCGSPRQREEKGNNLAKRRPPEEPPRGRKPLLQSWKAMGTMDSLPHFGHAGPSVMSLPLNSYASFTSPALSRASTCSPNGPLRRPTFRQSPWRASLRYHRK